MARLLVPSLAFMLAALAACQAKPVVAPATSPLPSTAASATAAPGASATPLATASNAASASAPASLSPSVSADRELVLGSLFDDEGGQLDGAQVAVTCDLDPSVNQTLQAPGSYAFRAPVGSTVKVTASKDGYTTRTRVHKVEAVAGNQNTDPNRLDFGGDGAGTFYALSAYPEIASVSPANLQTNVTSNPLVVTVTFSHALSASTRDRLNQILELQFQSPLGVQAVKSGTTYNNQRATLSWDTSSKVATLTFPAPVVANKGTASSVKVAFDSSVQPSDWPLGTNGKRLGRDLVTNAVSGNGGASGATLMAPILRDSFTDPVPVVRPSPLTLWGLTHWTDVSFSLAQDTSPLKVVSVAGYPGSGSAGDFIEVTFNKPVRGFPESALDRSAVATDNYRFALGSTKDIDAQRAYDAADPAKGGQAPQSVVFHGTRTDTVDLQLPTGALTNFNKFKIYVDPKVDDIYGTTLQGVPADPTHNLSANVMEGSVL